MSRDPEAHRFTRSVLDEHGRVDMTTVPNAPMPLDPLEKIVGPIPAGQMRDQLRALVADFLRRACGYDCSDDNSASSPILHVRIGERYAFNVTFTVARR